MRLIIPFLFLMCVTFQTRSQTQGVIQGDTLNKIDIHGRKQGKWVIKGKHQLKTEHASYSAEQKIEEGMYLNNKKEWIWIEYYPNGNKRNILTYNHGVLEGEAIFYGSNGKILKEGKFKGNKWVN